MNNFEENFKLALSNANRLSGKILIDGKLVSASTEKKNKCNKP